jgi:hypothetical protein
MSEVTPETPAGSVSATDNPNEWWAGKLKELGDGAQTVVDSEPVEQATEAEPVAATPEVPQPSWKELTFPDDPEVHGFFRGKPIPEVLKSYSEAEKRMAELGREANDLRAQLAARKALEDILGTRQPEPQKPVELRDRYAARGVDLDVDPIANPEKFAQATLELSREEVKRAKDEEAAQQEQKRQGVLSVIQAAERAREALGVAPDMEYGNRLMQKVIPLIRGRFGEDALRNPQAFYDTYLEEFGPVQATPASESAPSTPPPAVPVIPNPPGAKRPAPVAASNDKLPTLPKEQQRVIEQLRAAVKATGLVPEERLKGYEERAAQHLEQLKRRGY